MRLADKVTLITGAAGGQGRAAAVEFAREGSKVGLLDVDVAGLERTAGLVRGAGGEALSVAGDVAEPADVRRAVERTVAAFGKLNVLYNNAGIFWAGKGDGLVHELADEMWEKIVGVNLKGVYLCCKFAVPELIKAGGGSIVNISSLAGTRGAPRAHAYSAAKGGVIALTYAMAAAYAPQNIRVNAIAPGVIDTPINQPGWEADPEKLPNTLKRIPLGRVGQPEDVVRLGIFLASDESAWITGTVQRVDGGMSIV